MNFLRSAGILLCWATGLAAAAEELVPVQGGALWIEPRNAVLDALGLQLEMVDAAQDAGPFLGPASWNGRPEPARFDAVASDLWVVLDEGALRRFDGGRVRFRGGLRLRGGGGVLELPDLVLEPGVRVDTFRLGSGEEVWFELDHGHVGLLAGAGQLVSLNLDLRVGEGLARRLGRPELTGLGLGLAQVRLQTGAAGRGPARTGSLDLRQAGTGAVDLRLSDLGQVEQYARQAGEKVAFGPSTEVENVGTTGIPWYWSIGVAPDWAPEIGQHPYLVFNLYRESDGVLQQIGASDVKHAFFAANVDCEATPTSGQILLPGCRDTYGTANNGDAFHYAPRAEVQASTGSWVPEGSHFDGDPVDSVRDHDFEEDRFAHLLTAREGDLNTEGAQYFLEAWYLVQGDVNPWNNLGFLRICPRVQGNVWRFACDPEPKFVEGPVVDGWGRRRTTLIGEAGRLRLAVQTTELGESRWRYRYALLNLDVDRGLESFAVPIAPEANVRNLQFQDLDRSEANDWTASVSSHQVVWSTAGAAQNWGTLYAFSFEAALEPVETVVQLGVRNGESIRGPTLGVRAGDVPAPALLAWELAFAGLAAAGWVQWRWRKRRNGWLGWPGSRTTEA